MNRRCFLAGSLALAGQQQLLRSMGTSSVAGLCAPGATAPQNLLASTFTESFLAAHLAPIAKLHPYPRAEERAAWQAVPADLRAVAIAEAEADVKEGWPSLLASKFLEYKRNGNRSRFEAQSFGRRNQLKRLVLAECLEGKGRFLDEIANGVWLICEESFWGVPAHLSLQKAKTGLPDVSEPVVDLFAAETAQLMAWTHYLLGAQLKRVSPLIPQRIVLETERRILTPARVRDDFGWMGLKRSKSASRVNNWNPWINSNLMVANLLLEEDPKLRLAESLRIARSLDVYLNEYWPDAGEEEGPGYFSASPLCYFEAVHLLDEATGGASKIFANPFIGAMGRYILNAHVAGEDYINYGDAHVRANPEGSLLYRYGKACHDEELAAFGAYCANRHALRVQEDDGAKHSLGLPSMSRALPLLLDAVAVRAAKGKDVLVRDSWYPCMGLATARLNADSTDGFYFAVLASNNGRSHSHNDTGSYILYLDGLPLAIDAGVEQYSAKTFGPERYTLWTMRSSYHNLPTIGGIEQKNGEQYKASARKFSTDASRAAYSFDIAGAYPKEAGVKSWVRTVTLDRASGKILVEEAFELERAVPVSLTIMTQRKVEIYPGSLLMTLAGGDGTPASLEFDSKVLDPKLEAVPLTDGSMRSSWGPQLCRIQLNSRQPVARGKWSYRFVSA